jgi:capsular polysaccharide biosynthesis protein
MQETASTESYEFSDYIAVLRRRSRTILAWIILAALATGAYLAVGPKTYTATSTVYVTTNAANSQALLGSKTTTVVNMDNEAQVVMTTSVAKLVVKALGSSRTPTELLRQISVAVPANTQILQISCSARSASGSADCAEGFATAYLRQRQATAKSKVGQDIQTDVSREKVLEKQLQTVETQIAALRPNSADWIAAHSSIVNIATRLAPLRAAIASLSAANNYDAGYVMTKAIPPTSPSSPRKLLYGPSGLMAGLLVGLAMAFFKDRRDDRIHSPADIQRYLHIPVLCSLDRRPSDFRLAIARPGTPAGRAFTDLARVIATALGDGDHALLAVGTPDAGLVGANLAAAMARTQSDVLLVMPDPRLRAAPLLCRAVIEGAPGLTAVVSEGTSVTHAARPFPGVAGLQVIATDGTAEIIDDLPSGMSKRLAAELHSGARYVVIATEAPNGSGLVSLAEIAKSAIIVAEIGRSTRAEIASQLSRLAQMRTRVLGAIVLPPSGRISRAERRAYGTGQARETSQVSATREAGRREAGRREAGPREAGPREAGLQDAVLRDARLRNNARRDDPLRNDARADAAQQSTRSSVPESSVQPSSFLEEFTRTARSQAEPGPARPAPRTPGQTWPMPRVALPDASDERTTPPSSGHRTGHGEKES